MISSLIIPRRLEGLEESLASVTAQLGPRDEMLLAPLSRSARFRKAVADLAGSIPHRRVRLVGAGDYLPDMITGSFLLLLQEGDVLLPRALSNLRDFLKQVPGQHCVRLCPAGETVNNGRRRLFGVPLEFVHGKPYLLHRKLLSRLQRRDLLRALRDDSPDILLAMEEAGGGAWFSEPLLEPLKVARRNSLNLDQSDALLKKYVRRRKLDLHTRRVAGGIHIQADRSRGIDIELTNRCNAQCVFCPQDSMKHYGNMTDAVFERVLMLIREEPIGTIYFIGRGEPLMHPRFVDYVKEIRDLSGIEFEIFTNGLALTPSLVDRLADLNDPNLDITINVSLHSLKEETHHALTGTSLAVIAKNLRYLQGRADYLNITYAFVTNKVNQEEMASLRTYLDRTGNRKWDISLVYNKGGLVDEGSLFDQDFYRRHLSQQAFDSEPTGPCWYSYCGMYYWVNYHGQFTLCHDDFAEETILGELGRDNLDAIDARVAELRREGGAPRCHRCNKRQRELHHGGNTDADAQIKNHFILKVEASS